MRDAATLHRLSPGATTYCSASRLVVAGGGVGAGGGAGGGAAGGRGGRRGRAVWGVTGGRAGWGWGGVWVRVTKWTGLRGSLPCSTSVPEREPPVRRRLPLC